MLPLAVGSTPSPLVSLLGPIVAGVFEVDELSLVVLVGLTLLAAVLILCLPATNDFARQLIMLLLFFGAAFGVLAAQNAIAFYATWEITCLFAWGIGQLIGESATGDGLRVPFHAVGVLGSFAMLVGLGLLQVRRGTFALGVPTDGDLARLGPVPFLLLLGILLKSYGLLSEAWTVRPGRRELNLAGAVLAGAGLLAVGFYPTFRLFGPLLAESASWRLDVFWIGAGLAVVASLAALGEEDYRRALAHGALGQLGLITAIYSLGTAAAEAGAVFGAIVAAFAFTGLFLCVSATEEATSEASLARVGGLAQRMPLMAGLFVLSAVTLLGAPPLAGAVAGRAIGEAVNGNAIAPILWESMTGLTALYLLRLFATLFLGEPRGVVRSERSLASLVFSGSVVVGLALLITLSTDLLTLLEPIASVRLG